ncbi:MAG TPA: DUF6600 domain-containing protein [Anaeromyxobacteraceae bacterium]
MLRSALVSLAALTVPLLARPQADPDWPDEPGWQDVSPAPGDPEVDVTVAPGSGVTLDTFREGLAPHGEWVTVPRYGQVWRPYDLGADWRPYTRGRWEWTDEGWLWVSDEPFGWATYHYGRWAVEPGLGWFWVPGYRWAPAWVTWRYGPDYVGWAPLGPGWSLYASVSPIALGWWTFVPGAYFVGHPVWRHCYPVHQHRGLYAATRPAPPRSTLHGRPAPAWGGPSRRFVEERTGRPVVARRVHPVGSPHATTAPAGALPVYRPGARPARPSSASTWGGRRPGGPAQTPPVAAPRSTPRAGPQRGPRSTPGGAPQVAPRSAPRGAPQVAPRAAPSPRASPAPRAAPQAGGGRGGGQGGGGHGNGGRGGGHARPR